jgi:hypothetical protein
VGTPLGVFTGAFFTLFGLGVVGWCAAEIRTRRGLRRAGVPAMARVLADPQAGSDHADAAPVLSFQVEGRGEIVTRPRGWTSIRRAPVLAVDALVPVAYDPARPEQVAVQGVRQGRSDLFWVLLGLAFAGCGVALLAAAL